MADRPADRGALRAALRALVADADRRPLLVALDFDGTLAPLRDDPEHSAILPQGIEALVRLAAAGVRLALVSGRAMADLARLAKVPVGTVLIGSHGAERARVLEFGLDRAVAPLTAAQQDLLGRTSAMLASVSRGRNGVWMEAKPTAAVVHVRLAQPAVARDALAQARAAGQQLGLHLIEGKDVVELSVLDANKGEAVLALREDLAVGAVLYAGDDLTDEAALAVLGPGDIGIKVGEGQTAAGYRVADPQEMVDVLAELADAVTAGQPIR